MKCHVNETKQKRFQPSVEDYDTKNDWEDNHKDAQKEPCAPLLQDHYDIRLTPEWKRYYLVEGRAGEYRTKSHNLPCVWVLVADQRGGSCVKQLSKPMPPDWYLEGERKRPASPKATKIYDWPLRQKAHKPNNEQCYKCGLLRGKEEHHICEIEGNVPKPNSTGIRRCRLPRKHYVTEALYTRYFRGTTSSQRAELYQGANLKNSLHVDRTPTYRFVSTTMTRDYAPFSRKLNDKENQDAIRRGISTALPDTDLCSSKRPEESDQQRQVITSLISDITFLMIQYLKISPNWLASLLQSLSTSSSAIDEVSQRSAVYQAKYLCDIEDFVLLFEGPGANGLTPSMWVEVLKGYTAIEEDFTLDVWVYFINQCEELTSREKHDLRPLLELCENFEIEAKRYLEPYEENLADGKPMWLCRVLMVEFLADHAVCLAGRLRQKSCS